MTVIFLVFNFLFWSPKEQKKIGPCTFHTLFNFFDSKTPVHTQEMFKVASCMLEFGCLGEKPVEFQSVWTAYEAASFHPQFEILMLKERQIEQTK
jgi:hypothetical protein